MRSIARISRQYGFTLLIFSSLLASLIWPLTSTVADQGRGLPYLLVVWLLLLIVAIVLARRSQRQAVRHDEREALLRAHAEQLQALNLSLAERIQRQQQAEAALAKSEANYRSIFERAVEGVFQSTPEGRFISVNPSMATMLGFDSPEDMTSRVRDVGREHYVNPALRDELVETVRRDGSVTDFECELYRKDRSRVWISARARAIADNSGQLQIIEGFAQDITQRKRAEEAEQHAYKGMERRVRDRTAELQQANAELKTAMEAAEAATRAKSEFLANVSHEIRTPMNGVITAAELALNEDVSPRVSRLLHLIHSSGYSLLQIINDILDVSKIEAGRLSLDRRPFLLDEVVEGTIDLLAGRAVQDGVEMVLDFDMKTPKALVGDPIRLQQVLKNLLDNAIKFSERGGVVVVRVQVSETRDDAVELRFSVGDQGIGIAPEHLDRLFRPFSQVDTSNTRRYGGTGLGLSICKKLVEMMGGHIGVQSRAGSGSVFSFTARFGSTRSDESRTASLPEAVAGEVVLLVDRPGQARDALSRGLRSCGLEVVAVSSGQQAIERLAEPDRDAAPTDEPIGLVLLDWRLNELNGRSLVSRLRELGIGVPIIGMSATGASQADLDADEAHACVPRPLYPRALVGLLGDVFGDDTAVATETPRQRTSWLKRRLQGLRVLVAEDNPTSQEIMVASLERVGMTARVAPDGEQAMQMARGGQCDLVLMDIQMPRLDGIEATRLMRQDPELQDMPIVAVTAHAMKGDQDKFLEGGMDAYLSKPINQARLFRAMWKALKGRGRVSGPEMTIVEPEAQRTGPFRVHQRDLIEDLRGLSDALDDDDPEAVYWHLSAVSKRLRRTITAELEAMVDDHDYEHAADTVSRLMGEIAS